MYYSSLKSKTAILATALLFVAPVVFAQVTLPNPLGVDNIVDLIANITNYISGLVASLAVIMFVWAAILFLTSTGNEARLGTAKKVVWYAVIGLGIALAGTGLINLVKFIIQG